MTTIEDTSESEVQCLFLVQHMLSTTAFFTAMFSLHNKLVSSLFLPLCLSLSAYNNVWQCSSVGKGFRQKFEYISSLLQKLLIMWPFGNYVPTHFHSCSRKTALYMCNYKCD